MPPRNAFNTPQSGRALSAILDETASFEVDSGFSPLNYGYNQVLLKILCLFLWLRLARFFGLLQENPGQSSTGMLPQKWVVRKSNSREGTTIGLRGITRYARMFAGFWQALQTS